MSPIPALVVRAPGTHCHRETAHALALAGAAPEVAHLHEAERLPLAERYRLVVFPGGFSYGDDLGAGRLLALRLRARLLPALRALIDRGGLILGICNGFQALVAAGLLPGDGRRASLTVNASGRFETRWTRLQVTDADSPWLPRGEVLDLPVAHAEGRLVFASEADRRAVAAQVALRYLEPTDGAPGVAGTAGRSPAAYPANPAGSTDDIAGLIDPTGRVLGLMPHPERNVEPWHRVGWTRRTGAGASGPGAGLRLLKAGLASLAESR